MDGPQRWTEDEIKEKYYPWWKERMEKKKKVHHVISRYDDISFENCLLDWQIIHWAYEVKDESI